MAVKEAEIGSSRSRDPNLRNKQVKKTNGKLNCQRLSLKCDTNLSMSSLAALFKKYCSNRKITGNLSGEPAVLQYFTFCLQLSFRPGIILCFVS